MYHYVRNSVVKPWRSFTADKMNRVKQMLKAEYNLDTDFYLVGSGAKNLVTQNENEPFDLDWNLEVYNLAEPTKNAEWLKTTVMDFLNEIMEDTPFRNCQDSTAVITSRWTTEEGLKFSFDIAILVENSNGIFCRMIHDKFMNRFYWTEVPDSKDVYDRMDKLKENGWWQEIRDTYLEKKNMYLRRIDRDNHPLFNIFVETINEVWYKACHQRR
ncbi:hypothetical protein [Treponema zioleckii]|uniref:hypothetical protein n=1 Tax=Treponema zioleckii TaxID=331680 RepID=UPI00168A7BDD|nr:hypothetical protein [Treponema zioleckii]